MSKFLKQMDSFHRLYLKEDTNAEAVKATEELIQTFADAGIVASVTKHSDTHVKIILPNSNQSVLVQVFGFYTGKAETASVAGVEEDEEEPVIDTNINSDKQVQQAQLNALQRVQQKLQMVMNK